MPNQFSLQGAQAQKPTRFSTIYTGRFSNGLWTNRSPLRDASTSRISEKFYGAAGDALIAGENVEVTNRLTLARRPGNSTFDANSYSSVGRFDEFRVFSSTDEQIQVMVDQALALYAAFSGAKNLVWTKSTGAGKSYMQAVGNSLYFGNGKDNKKWLQTLNVWSSLAVWSGPLYSTFIIDTNGNIQQLTQTGTSAASEPTWSTQVPSSANSFTGGVTTDGTAHWTNRGNPVMNWGIAAGTSAPSPIVGTGRAQWQADTFYSLTGSIVDSNGNVQKVTTAGKSAGAHPTWATSVGLTTTDGTITWTMTQTAASLVWAAHTAYTPGALVVGNASGTNCVFQLAPYSLPTIVGSITAKVWDSPHTGAVGAVTQTNPPSAPVATATGTSFLWNTGSDISAQPGKWETLNAAGETTGTTSPFSELTDYQIAFYGTINIPVAGQYTFTITHHDGMLFGVGGGATKVSGPSTDALGHTGTVQNNYPIMGANNVSGTNTDTVVVNFPTSGSYGIEVDYDFWYHSGNTLNVQCNGQNITPGTPTSGTTQPVWPGWSTSYAPSYANVAEGSGHLVWNNIGPATDFSWLALTNFTLPDTVIVDPNTNTEAPFRSGATSTVTPGFSTLLNQLTNDNPNLIWINLGAAAAAPVGTISTFLGGWQYGIALVNTLDNTVSNCGPLSASTGSFNGVSGVSFSAGDGLPSPSAIDSQSDFVAIFRTTDGQATPFLVPGATTTYTLPLSTYLTSGYTDTTADTALNNLIEGAVALENTPPGAGAINLTYHLGRIFFSIGNTVYWSSGADAPVGNGTDGVGPLNFDVFPSQVKRLVPVGFGLLVFTVSDIFSISGQGTATNPIQRGVPLAPGVGLLSYDALDLNGGLIGMYTTDNQFILLNTAAGGIDYAGFPIGDQFRLNNGLPGQSWSAANVYVNWHVDGEDQAWYVGDGQFGYYRLMATPAPESGYTWSTFSNLTGGCKAIKSVEITPGVHKLLIGPFSSGSILERDLNIFQDNGTSYPAWAVIGSAVLAQPGQVATVSFITTDSIRIGTPIVLGVLFDEALPYYNGPFELIKEWENDPPGLKPSRSLLSQRFYMNESQDEAVCRHMQIQVNWATENVQNELLTLSVFGGFLQEQ